MPRADLVQYFHKGLAGPGRSEKVTPPIATEGDQMEIAASIKAPQRVAHGRKARPAETSKPAPLKNTRVRHPSVRLLPTNDITLMRYSAGDAERSSAPPARGYWVERSQATWSNPNWRCRQPNNVLELRSSRSKGAIHTIEAICIPSKTE
jgi:hypothetical protein